MKIVSIKRLILPNKCHFRFFKWVTRSGYFDPFFSGLLKYGLRRYNIAINGEIKTDTLLLIPSNQIVINYEF